MITTEITNKGREYVERRLAEDRGRQVRALTAGKNDHGLFDPEGVGWL